ncbi:phospholipid scramblase 1-like [Sitodiplosis mosellana]|uniref:phospholipid scramblase 1-like n=1 Tax=Sitodiplosis mosellana TaxID=263140 RepID=UPI002444AB92|nr:phospholipid scramblase 1-like [Sitodiplosis mosellana]
MEENPNTRTLLNKNAEEPPSPPSSYDIVVGAQPSGQHLPSAICTQPHFGNSNGAMNVPRQIPNCPRGLEYLTTVDQLLIKQQVELGLDNRFVIKNAMGQNIYHADEDADCCAHLWCGSDRSFDMIITDNYDNRVMQFFRPTAIGFSDSIEVSAPIGQVIGRIVKQFDLVFPTFKVKNQYNETVLYIEGPAITTGFFGDVEFKVVKPDGVQVGKICKQWSGLAREFFTYADYFGINFPIDLDVRIKAVLLGACLLINSIYYERR